MMDETRLKELEWRYAKAMDSKRGYCSECGIKCGRYEEPCKTCLEGPPGASHRTAWTCGDPLLAAIPELVAAIRDQAELRAALLAEHEAVKAWLDAAPGDVDHTTIARILKCKDDAERLREEADRG